MKIIALLVSSLRSKLLIMFILLTVFPLIFVGMISYGKSEKLISENAFTAAELQAAQLSQEIDVIFQDALRFTEIGKQEDTMRFLNRTGVDTYEEAKTILSLFAFYREIIPSSKNILDVSITNHEGKTISESKGVFKKDQSELVNLVEKEVNGTSNDIKIETIIVNNIPVISITRPIIWDITYEVIGYITILLDSTVVQEKVENALIGTTGSFFITSSADEQFIFPYMSDSFSSSKNDNSSLKIASFQEDFSDRSIFTVSHTSDVTGWNIVGAAPKKEIMKDANDIRSLIIVSVLSSIMFTITLYYFISSRLIRPIRNLKEKMKQASLGDLDVKVISESSDEIADLGISFNRMITKIKSLLQNSIDEEKKLKIAELRALQAQINPHFLYNTLDTIIWSAEANKGKDVINITKALSHFFRISLSKGRDLITIEEEVKHVENYLIIQKNRYRDILDVTITINEEILNFIILKLTLQPLVENAIYHGIKNKRRKGHVQIDADYDSNGHICFCILDNGIGIKEEDLLNIRDHLDKGQTLNKADGGFGMYNIQERTKLFYGEPFGLTIDSIYGTGTTVCLTIPAKR
ncbi:two-component sensor histidine kinase [Salipaludibacillus neizhouensis]|uniref:Two-component sensor histidine kinase n=1 Tax=Salipaludibacillus neizhouensis TaxID=885475 RepID=A0A3A9JXM1_9BACI|nr:sensor histidine kinase [Salipaludibacillus neizhouensis]RKL65644.1 two-component sensor histidine kinase [Salipaludibacillus neizhouensis]